MDETAPRERDAAIWTFVTSGQVTSARAYGISSQSLPDGSHRVILLAPGAGAGQEHPFMVALAQALVAQGVVAITFDFPYAHAGRRRPDPPPTLQQAWRDAIASLRSQSGYSSSAIFIGGKSMGGRVATEVAAAERGSSLGLAGVVCFGYPLRPPRRSSARSVAHFAKVGVPMLIVQGTRDAFGGPADVEAAARGVAGLEVLPIDGADHAFAVPRRSGRTMTQVLDVVTAHVVRWMARVCSPEQRP